MTEIAMRPSMDGVEIAAPARSRRMDALRWSMLAVMFAYVWRAQDIFPILATLQFPTLATGAAFFFLIVNRTALTALRQRARLRPVKLMLLLLAIMLAGVPLSLYRGASLSFITDDYVKTLLMTAIIAAGCRDVADLRRVALAHVAGGALYCYVILLRFSVGASGRLGDLVYYDANDLGLLIVSTIPMLLYFTRPAERRWLRTMAIGLFAFYMLTAIRTGSRGAFLGLLGVGVFILFTFPAIKPHMRIAWIGGAVVFMALTAGGNYWAMMRSITDPNDYNRTEETGRKKIWKRGMGYMFQRPLLGVGASAFPVAEGKISPLAPLQRKGIGVRWGQAHNSFVQLGAELGVIGFVAFLMLVFGTLRSMVRMRKAPPDSGKQGTEEAAIAQAIAGALIGYAICGFFLSQAYSAFLYSILGMAIALLGLRGVNGRGRRSRRARGPAYGRAPLLEVPTR